MSLVIFCNGVLTIWWNTTLQWLYAGDKWVNGVPNWFVGLDTECMHTVINGFEKKKNESKLICSSLVIAVELQCLFLFLIWVLWKYLKLITWYPQNLIDLSQCKHEPTSMFWAEFKSHCQYIVDLHTLHEFYQICGW